MNQQVLGNSTHGEVAERLKAQLPRALPGLPWPTKGSPAFNGVSYDRGINFDTSESRCTSFEQWSQSKDLDELVWTTIVPSRPSYNQLPTRPSDTVGNTLRIGLATACSPGFQRTRSWAFISLSPSTTKNADADKGDITSWQRID